MRLPIEILLLALSHVSTALPLTRRSVPFPSLRGLTTLVNSFSNGHIYTKSAPTKYFYESTFNSHYDGRFASSEVAFQERVWHLRLMLKAYTETMERIGVKTWIMHGCLLGWWWNGGLMPWDKDLDFLVEEDGVKELGNWWNMTVHHFSWQDLGLDKNEENRPQPLSEIGKESVGSFDAELEKRKRETWEQDVRRNGKRYLLEVNPNYVNTSTTDTFNHIDARWIDVSNGLYIDITTVHEAPTTFASSSTTSFTPFSDEGEEVRTYTKYPKTHEDDEDDEGVLMYVKDTHAYLSTQLFPLRRSTLEGVPVYLPYSYESLLLEEYGPDALTESWYNGYAFTKSLASTSTTDKEKGEWFKKSDEDMTEAERKFFKDKFKNTWVKGHWLPGGSGRASGVRMSGTGRITHGRLGSSNTGRRLMNAVEWDGRYGKDNVEQEGREAV
jgi:hypothetical protein